MSYKRVFIQFISLLMLNTALLFPLFAQTSLPDHPQPQNLPDSPQPQPSAGSPKRQQTIDAEWPRTAARGDEKVSMYQPQLESWQGDEIHSYAALSVENKDS